MPKKLIKKSTINKVSKLLFKTRKKPKRKPRLAPVLEKKLLPGQVVFLDYGSHLIIPVYGEHYAQDHRQTALKSLYSKYGEKVIDFSLAPQDDYQRQMKWPEEPFMNVLPRGNFYVNRGSWLGYISPFEPENSDKIHKDRQAYTDKLVKLGKLAPVIIKGKIIKEGSEYSVILFASHEEIDKYLDELS